MRPLLSLCLSAAVFWPCSAMAQVPVFDLKGVIEARIQKELGKEANKLSGFSLDELKAMNLDMDTLIGNIERDLLKEFEALTNGKDFADASIFDFGGYDNGDNELIFGGWSTGEEALAGASNSPDLESFIQDEKDASWDTDPNKDDYLNALDWELDRSERTAQIVTGYSKGLMANSENRIERYVELERQIGQTQNVKASQDLLNMATIENGKNLSKQVDAQAAQNVVLAQMLELEQKQLKMDDAFFNVQEYQDYIAANAPATSP